ncbi:MAG: hypothetical protein ACLFNQ_12310 [Spirochaetaceae bacterium]
MVKLFSVILLTVTIANSCDLLSVASFPDFLAYTDISVDLGSRVDDIWSRAGSIEYRIEMVGTDTDAPRLLLLVEPPTQSTSSGFEYLGRLLVFDADLNLLNTAEPLSDLDTFGRPFVFGPDGNILAGNTILDPDGVPQDTLPFLGFEGPGVTVPAFTDPPAVADPSIVVFSLPAGEFTGFDMQWARYTDATFPWTLQDQASLSILAPGNRPASASEGFQILDAAFHPVDDQVTLLLSQPAVQRVVAVRFDLTELLDGNLSELLPSGDDFRISIAADRPLDTHATAEGFFLRRRDGWLEYYRWTQQGQLDLVENRVRIAGDRSFNRSFAFLVTDGQQYMYRFDPASRILTRYRRWW